ncbi:extensin family protein [Phaeobacter inhibens]|uniref:extensin-like domain-containing protein n=1 Tax=Phaeobacter inhibens TaxID=221822 RepID=UPI000C9AC91F|nr:extensin family protein [Phaeobacter inhibens]AUQ55094.1 extensin-like protein [Phaeobacter inhibens]AUQ79110.1 extensin-like protein [Phaeobacter inhibens]AUR16269.1 extensin-like protein [Phaeobacter inhibens]
MRRGWTAGLRALSIAGGLTALIAASAGATAANAPETSLRPSARPDLVSGATVTAAALSVTEKLRPQSRPQSDQAIALAALSLPLVPAGPDASLRPHLRPGDLAEKILFGKRKRRKTSVCGDIDIQGSKVGTVPGRLNGCGAKNAVRVRSVAGVTLSQQSVMTCDTARALKKWVERDVIKAFGRRDKVVSLRVAAHYSCRTRNNRPGAKISEHGRGKAIDISGFVLESGKVITVLKGWTARATRKGLRKMWKGACGPFGTVLGPLSDRYHLDHFHLDVARHRGGPYCR